MSNTVIKVENLGKLYRLGEIGTGTLSHDLNRWWAKMRGKEDPFAKVGETNDRTVKSESNYAWALKDVSFEVKQGEVLGIIGRNGAGKSTLLKILSKVTNPSEGKIKIKGRIASLLEVGTGFHPELTGRENIFLNGAILGMTKGEIRRKFDEIVDFAGVERYIDTPVKRYSSGMYVRLAFAVAAFLEPEILIVDEVLAVGDAEFQKKCLGRMQDVSQNDGRTILFVSHNMAAMQKLCTKGMLMENGRLKQVGLIDSVVSSYLNMYHYSESASVDLTDYRQRTGSGTVTCHKIELFNTEGESTNKFAIGDSLIVTLHVKAKEKIKNLRIGIQLYEPDGTAIANILNEDSKFIIEEIEGEQAFSIRLDNIRLYPENYSIGFYLGSTQYSEIYDYVEKVLTFEMINDGRLTSRILSRPAGLLLLTPEWSLFKIN